MTSITTAANISVVITCYREGELLMDAVNSALSQYPLEVIIVNDASTHEPTNAVCREIDSHPLVTVLWHKENGGPSIARNYGFEQAKGDILVPLDADDLLPDDALQSLIVAFNSKPDVGFVYGAYLRQNTLDKPAQVVKPDSISLRNMLRANTCSLSSRWQLLGTTPIKRAVWERLGGYDPTFGAQDLHDVEFWIRVLDSGCQYAFTNEPIYIWRKYLGRNSGQVTPLSWAQIARKYYSIYQSVGLEYRACELLLMGSKWKNNIDESKQYRKKLSRCIMRGEYQFSSLVALLIPSALLKSLSQIAGQYR